MEATPSSKRPPPPHVRELDLRDLQRFAAKRTRRKHVADALQAGGHRFDPGRLHQPVHGLLTTARDASVASAGELGGTALLSPMHISMGKIAILQDPQGAVFALFAGDLEP